MSLSICISAVILREASAGLCKSTEEKELTSTSLLPRTSIVDIIKLLCATFKKGLIATLISDTPISLSERISNLLVAITFGAFVYPDPPSIRSTLITCPLLTSTFALAPPPSPFSGINFRIGGVKY